MTFLKTYQNAPLGNGVVNYGGTLNADHTEIEGSWQIPEKMARLVSKLVRQVSDDP